MFTLLPTIMEGILESFDTMNVAPSSPEPAVAARPTVSHERFSDMDTRSVKFKVRLLSARRSRP